MKKSPLEEISQEMCNAADICYHKEGYGVANDRTIDIEGMSKAAIIYLQKYMICNGDRALIEFLTDFK